MEKMTFRKSFGHRINGDYVVSVTDYGYGLFGYRVVDISHRWVFPARLNEFRGNRIIGCP